MMEELNPQGLVLGTLTGGAISGENQASRQ